MSWSDVQKNSWKCKWRKSQSKIKADEEFGTEMPWKGYDRTCRKLGEHQSWKWESTSGLVACAANITGTWKPVTLASSSNSSEWNNDDKWSSQVRKFVEMLGGNRYWYGLWHRRRIGPSWTEWMTDCERCWTVLQKIQCKTLTNGLWFGECLRLRHWKYLCSCERIHQTICIHQKYRWKSHFKADVRETWKVDIGAVGWDFWSVSNQLGK